MNGPTGGRVRFQLAVLPLVASACGGSDDVAGSDDDIMDVSERLAVVEMDAARAQDDIDALVASLAVAEARIASLEDDLVGLDSLDLTELIGRVDDNRQDFTLLDGRVMTIESDYASQTSVTSIDGRISLVESDYATGTELASVDTRVSAIESDYATATSLQSLDGRLSAVESDYATASELVVVEERLSDLTLELGVSQRVFVTSASYAIGSFGSVTGADALCQSHADSAGLGGTWMAWLSGGANSGPDVRFVTQASWPYLRIDGEVVALHWDDLTDGTIASPIGVDEFGNATPQNLLVWTAVNGDGSGRNLTCSDWTDSSPTVLVGEANDPGPHWTARGSLGCGGSHALYCFEQ